MRGSVIAARTADEDARLGLCDLASAGCSSPPSQRGEAGDPAEHHFGVPMQSGDQALKLEGKAAAAAASAHGEPERGMLPA